MPIVHIYSRLQKSESNVVTAIKTLSNTIAKEMSIPPYSVRCIWQQIQPFFYVQGIESHQETQTHEISNLIINFTLFERERYDFYKRHYVYYNHYFRRSIRN